MRYRVGPVVTQEEVQVLFATGSENMQPASNWLRKLFDR